MTVDYQNYELTADIDQTLSTHCHSLMQTIERHQLKINFKLGHINIKQNKTLLGSLRFKQKKSLTIE